MHLDKASYTVSGKSGSASPRSNSASEAEQLSFRRPSEAEPDLPRTIYDMAGNCTVHVRRPVPVMYLSVFYLMTIIIWSK